MRSRRKNSKAIAKLFALYANAKQYRQLPSFSRYKQTHQEVSDNISHCELNLLHARFSGHNPYENGDIDFSSCHGPHIGDVIKASWWEPLTVNYNLAQFGVHRSSGKRVIMYLICHMTSQDHLIEGSCEFIRVEAPPGMSPP